MTLSMHSMAVDTFVPMLESLSEWLDKGAAHAKANKLDLISMRLAPDMYTLAQQVQQACHHALDGVARLTGIEPAPMGDSETTLPGLQAQIASTVANLRGIHAGSFEGAEQRDCSIAIPEHKIIAMDGSRFLRAWALPHFYFHVVTAYDILRHSGVALGVQDYLSQVGAFIQPKASS